MMHKHIWPTLKISTKLISDCADKLNNLPTVLILNAHPAPSHLASPLKVKDYAAAAAAAAT